MRVSVLLPTYQRPALLLEALDSLRRQTMPASDFEVIVANDGGPALDEDIIAGLQGRVLNLPENGGQSAANNAALSVAAGEYVTVAHDDDRVLPVKLQALSEALDASDPEVCAVFGLPVYADADGHETGVPKNVRRFLRRHPLVRLHDAMSEGLFVHGTSLLYRKSALDAVGGWDESLPTAEEFDLHLRLLQTQGAFKGLEVPVVTYRAGGKHVLFTRTGKRDRSVMNRIYAKLEVNGRPMGAF